VAGGGSGWGGVLRLRFGTRVTNSAGGTSWTQASVPAACAARRFVRSEGSESGKPAGRGKEARVGQTAVRTLVARSREVGPALTWPTTKVIHSGFGTFPEQAYYATGACKIRCTPPRCTGGPLVQDTCSPALPPPHWEIVPAPVSPAPGPLLAARSLRARLYCRAALPGFWPRKRLLGPSGGYLQQRAVEGTAPRRRCSRMPSRLTPRPSSAS
jgi:hypothetical protein